MFGGIFMGLAQARIKREEEERAIGRMQNAFAALQRRHGQLQQQYFAADPNIIDVEARLIDDVMLLPDGDKHGG